MAAALAYEFLALLTLALCWACALSASCLLVSIAPLAAERLGANTELAPFTCGVFMLGAACVSAPSAPLFQALGRRGAFFVGASAGIFGGVIGVVATLFNLRAFFLFVACALVGLAQGMAYFYRFAALEVCAPPRKHIAVNLVLSGGIIAAFAGPQLAIATRHIVGSPSIGPFARADDMGAEMVDAFDGVSARVGVDVGSGVELTASEFVGSFGAIVCLHLLNAVLSLAVCLPPAGHGGGAAATERLLDDDHLGGAPPPLVLGGRDVPTASRGTLGKSALDEPPLMAPPTVPPLTSSSSAATPMAPPPVPPPPRRPLQTLVAQPRCLVAIGIATVAQTSMVMLMSPLVLAMQDLSFASATRTLTYELHFASMYGPGLLTAKLIDKCGVAWVATLGGLCFGASLAVLWTGTTSGHFMGGMALCGVGWNLCFASATLLLDTTYTEGESTRVQAFNDFVVLFSAAGGSLGSGYVYHSSGDRWDHVVYAAAALTALLVPLLIAHLCCEARCCSSSCRRACCCCCCGGGGGGAPSSGDCSSINSSVSTSRSSVGGLASSGGGGGGGGGARHAREVSQMEEAAAEAWAANVTAAMAAAVGAAAPVADEQQR